MRPSERGGGCDKTGPFTDQHALMQLFFVCNILFRIEGGRNDATYYKELIAYVCDTQWLV